MDVPPLLHPEAATSSQLPPLPFLNTLPPPCPPPPSLPGFSSMLTPSKIQNAEHQTQVENARCSTKGEPRGKGKGKGKPSKRRRARAHEAPASNAASGRSQGSSAGGADFAAPILPSELQRDVHVSMSNESRLPSGSICSTKQPSCVSAPFPLPVACTPNAALSGTSNATALAAHQLQNQVSLLHGPQAVAVPITDPTSLAANVKALETLHQHASFGTSFGAPTANATPAPSTANMDAFGLSPALRQSAVVNHHAYYNHVLPFSEGRPPQPPLRPALNAGSCGVLNASRGGYSPPAWPHHPLMIPPACMNAPRDDDTELPPVHAPRQHHQRNFLGKVSKTRRRPHKAAAKRKQSRKQSCAPSNALEAQHSLTPFEISNARAKASGGASQDMRSPTQCVPHARDDKGSVELRADSAIPTSSPNRTPATIQDADVFSIRLKGQGGEGGRNMNVNGKVSSQHQVHRVPNVSASCGRRNAIQDVGVFGYQRVGGERDWTSRDSTSPGTLCGASDKGLERHIHQRSNTPAQIRDSLNACVVVDVPRRRVGSPVEGPDPFPLTAKSGARESAFGRKSGTADLNQARALDGLGRVGEAALRLRGPTEPPLKKTTGTSVLSTGQIAKSNVRKRRKTRTGKETKPHQVRHLAHGGLRVTDSGAAAHDLSPPVAGKVVGDEVAIYPRKEGSSSTLNRDDIGVHLRAVRKDNQHDLHARVSRDNGSKSGSMSVGALKPAVVTSSFNNPNHPGVQERNQRPGSLPSSSPVLPCWSSDRSSSSEASNTATPHGFVSKSESREKTNDFSVYHASSKGNVQPGNLVGSAAALTSKEGSDKHRRSKSSTALPLATSTPRISKSFSVPDDKVGSPVPSQTFACSKETTTTCLSTVSHHSKDLEIGALDGKGNREVETSHLQNCLSCRKRRVVARTTTIPKSCAVAADSVLERTKFRCVRGTDGEGTNVTRRGKVSKCSTKKRRMQGGSFAALKAAAEEEIDNPPCAVDQSCGGPEAVEHLEGSCLQHPAAAPAKRIRSYSLGLGEGAPICAELRSGMQKAKAKKAEAAPHNGQWPFRAEQRLPSVPLKLRLRLLDGVSLLPAKLSEDACPEGRRSLPKQPCNRTGTKSPQRNSHPQAGRKGVSQKTAVVEVGRCNPDLLTKRTIGTQGCKRSPCETSTANSTTRLHPGKDSSESATIFPGLETDSSSSAPLVRGALNVHDVGARLKTQSASENAAPIPKDVIIRAQTEISARDEVSKQRESEMFGAQSTRLAAQAAMRSISPKDLLLNSVRLTCGLCQSTMSKKESSRHPYLCVRSLYICRECRSSLSKVFELLATGSSRRREADLEEDIQSCTLVALVEEMIFVLLPTERRQYKLGSAYESLLQRDKNKAIALAEALSVPYELISVMRILFRCIGLAFDNGSLRWPSGSIALPCDEDTRWMALEAIPRSIGDLRRGSTAGERAWNSVFKSKDSVLSSLSSCAIFEKLLSLVGLSISHVGLCRGACTDNSDSCSIRILPTSIASAMAAGQSRASTPSLKKVLRATANESSGDSVRDEKARCVSATKLRLPQGCCCLCAASYHARDYPLKFYGCARCPRQLCSICVTNVLGASEYVRAIHAERYLCIICRSKPPNGFLVTKQAAKESSTDLESHGDRRSALSVTKCKELPGQPVSSVEVPLLLLSPALRRRLFRRTVGERDEEDIGFAKLCELRNVESFPTGKLKPSCSLCFVCKRVRAGECDASQDECRAPGEESTLLQCAEKECFNVMHKDCVAPQNRTSMRAPRKCQSTSMQCPQHKCGVCSAREESNLVRCRTCPRTYCCVHLPRLSSVHVYSSKLIACPTCRPCLSRPQFSTKVTKVAHTLDLTRKSDHRAESDVAAAFAIDQRRRQAAMLRMVGNLRDLDTFSKPPKPKKAGLPRANQQ